MLLSIVAAFAAAASSGVGEPQAIDPEAWVAMGDYPREALRRRWQGVVGFAANVGADGRPSACTVISSSGHDLLDGATCKVIMQRARFRPATDATGRPVAGLFSSQVTWNMGSARRAAPLASYALTATFDVDSDGAVISCHGVSASGAADAGALCRSLIGTNYAPLAGGGARTRHVTYTTSLEVK